MTLTVDIKSILTAKLAELNSVSVRREDIAIQPQPDPLDNLQHIADVQVVITRLSMQGVTVRQVQDALGRIANGDYGQCTDCDGKISLARLKAIPWAARCRSCQEIRDREATTENETMVEAGAE